MKNRLVMSGVVATALALGAGAIVPFISSKTTAYADSLSKTECIRYDSARATALSGNEIEDDYVKEQVEYLIAQVVANEGNVVVERGVTYEFNDFYSYYTGEKAGYVIDFTYYDMIGYMIVSVDDVSVMPREVSFGNRSPYYGKDGKYLYQGNGRYHILTEDNQIISITEENKSTVKKKQGSVTGTEETFEFDYASGGMTRKYRLPNIHCLYSNYDSIKGYNNNCANVAGVIVLNYWNAYYNNELLNLKKGEFSVSYPKSMAPVVAGKYMDTFYEYMNTNPYFNIWGGTAPNDGYIGFEKLIKEKGFVTKRYTISSYVAIKSNIMERIPVFITSRDYYFGDMRYNSENSEYVFDAKRCEGLSNSHTFVAYGYEEYDIYDRNGQLTKIQLLEVDDGWADGITYFHIAESDVWSAAAIKVSRC